MHLIATSILVTLARIIWLPTVFLVGILSVDLLPGVYGDMLSIVTTTTLLIVGLHIDLFITIKYLKDNK